MTGEVQVRVSIDYADQNEVFGRSLPVSGTVGHSLQAAGDPRSWWVVDLDAPLEYQLKIGEPYRFRLITTDQLVVATRESGKDIGARTAVPVHILLPLRPEATIGTTLSPEAFVAAAWGYCTRNDAA